MATVTLTYQGDLRVECVHAESGATLVTDAPKDNNGQGRAFSPTDLCATSTAACATTIMAMYGNNHGLDLKGMKAEVTKVMAATPRRIARLEIAWTMPDLPYTENQKSALEHAVRTCPVFASLHPDMEKHVIFHWPAC